MTFLLKIKSNQNNNTETCIRGDHKALGGRLAILRRKLNSRTFQGEYFRRWIASNTFIKTVSRDFPDI